MFMDTRKTKLLIINILTCSKARAHAQKCESLKHCNESLESDDINTFGLYIEQQHIC